MSQGNIGMGMRKVYITPFDWHAKSTVGWVCEYVFAFFDYRVECSSDFRKGIAFEATCNRIYEALLGNLKAVAVSICDVTAESLKLGYPDYRFFHSG